eukprot:gnl/TRDRNA2_/TRDRNA2_196071_c0_seq1.p1 gnl/TRDRNA2_/TRDRNA2_196071_c0~~gnl/TRDRNA2_/TRDRNA2_196071_c0_seq1.p1  ORF type:complete len:105 (+),score=20.26 gnl/TRDRNA2_/TRDRNA2_196071_c0_seq1:77-391(+)
MQDGGMLYVSSKHEANKQTVTFEEHRISTGQKRKLLDSHSLSATSTLDALPVMSFNTSSSLPDFDSDISDGEDTNPEISKELARAIAYAKTSFADDLALRASRN